MDPVSNVDAIVMLLRQRLLEQSRRSTSPLARGAGLAPDRAVSRPIDLQALAAAEGMDDRQLGRALVQTVLAEHFGGQVINAPQFQQLVDRVNGALNEDPRASQWLQTILSELRGPRR